MKKVVGLTIEDFSKVMPPGSSFGVKRTVVVGVSGTSGVRKVVLVG